ncbi:thyroid receptor-interacting protein 11-like isoform X2 [Portunus trituberculatus]|uniref:thyroid receptor-interacting protein 11-like isoform X2 n=1 Tax=Portunus trituberculatus TaxID=210409 RepID=UPI001E1CD8F9|nr:thyroid receptor-interacting protein 11-like isoform X2 [Portunus trituberculatus]
MSWFGVSLNDIKGQLTSFTNEVLSEGLEDVEDGGQVIVSRERIQELESLCQLQKHELEEAKRAREDLEERLQVANLHGSHQVSGLRQQLQHKENELRQLREKSVEWGWGAGDGEGGGGGGGGGGSAGTPKTPSKQQRQTSPSSPGQQAQQDEQQHTPEKQLVWQEQLNQQLSRRVEELEGELVRLREAHQEEVSALQDHHRQHLLSLTPRPDVNQAEGDGGGDGGGTETPTPRATKAPSQRADGATDADQDAATQRCRALEQERDKLQAALADLQARLQQLTPKADAAAGLETQVAALSDRCAALQRENEQNEKSLEELDTQHQQVVEQILKKKKEVQEEAQALRTAHQQVTEALSQVHVDQEKTQQETETLQAELAALRLSEETAQATLKKQLEAYSEEFSDLKGQLNEKTTLAEELKKEFQVMRQENARLQRLEEAKERSQCSDMEEKSILAELQSLQIRYEEEKRSNAELKTTLENMNTELQKLRSSEESLRASSSNSEEKQKVAETKAVQLEEQVASLMQEVASLKLTVTDTQTILESSQEKESLQERINITEAAKCLVEQELQKCRQSLDDAKARTEILESELQAKAQELTMSNTSITELDMKVKQAESDLTAVDRSQTEEMEELKKALAHHNQEVPKTVKAGVHRLVELLRDSVWQRDTLERHVSTLSQELREKNDLLGEAELSRAELERECEDLRDQLEEVQKGVRPPPEGSSRGLPTIEEEAEGGAEGEVEGEHVKESVEVREEQLREPLELERSNEIEALHAQVEALSEARRNLETEAASMRAERDQLHGQLQQMEGRAGNLANLETEAAALRNEKKSLEMQLETLAQELDLTTVTLQDERDTLKEQLNTKGEHHQSVQVELSILKHERNSIGQQLVSQYKVLEERDATIRMLENEIDGLKDTLRETFGDQNKSLVASLQEELNTVKSQLIYKEDKVDALSQMLQQIAGIFEVEDTNSNIDRTRQVIQDKYTTLIKNLEEKEEKIKEMSEKITNLQSELETYKMNSESEAETFAKLSEKVKELSLAKDQLTRSAAEAVHLQKTLEEKCANIKTLENSAQVLQNEIALLEHKQVEDRNLLDQRNSELEHLREDFNKAQHASQEKEDLANILTRELEEARAKITSEEKTIQDVSEEAAKKNRDITEKEAKISALSLEVNTLKKELEELKMQEKQQSTQLSNTEAIIQQEQKLRTENTQLLEEKNLLLQEKERKGMEMEELRVGQETALRELGVLKGEREQMIATITHKHQESLSYHNEIQRLSQVLTQTTQQHRDESATLASQLKESEGALAESRSLVASLREELHTLGKAQSELQKNAAEGIVQKTELSGLRKEFDSLRAKFTILEQERDQLRLANSRFNTQYQDQSKELSNIKERESRLAGECERLRQHLMTVEESYTAEALKGEEREATLRSTLAKMEEKLNSHSSLLNSTSQRASVQVEALQEQLQEISAKRDDAVLRLHAAEESAEQHQHSLETLQQVLQDFQKNQAREIAEATERTRRKLEDEQEKTASLGAQLGALKSQLAEAQGGLAAASRLGDQLAKKEQMIVALKAQVSSQEEVAKRARDEVSCLKNSSEGKVEKPLLRNLLVGYFATPVDKRQEVLRIIAEVLDFSTEERSRTGLDTQGTSWLSSIANFLAPPASNVRVTSKVDVLDHTSLSQAFIRFLEDESNPRPQPRLPAVQMAQQTTEKAEKKAQAKAQAANKINPFISSGDTQVPDSDQSPRNSSPLLAAASTPPTLPSFAPQQHHTPSTLAAPSPLPPGSAPAGLTPVSTNKYLTNLLTPDAGKSDENANKHPT